MHARRRLDFTQDEPPPLSASFHHAISELKDRGGIQFRWTIVTSRIPWGHCDASLT